MALPIEKTANYIRIRVATVKNVTRFRFKLLSAKKGIRALIAFIKGGGSKVVSILFYKKKGWTLAKARAWIKSHGYSVTETYLVYGINVTPNTVEFVEEVVPKDYVEESEEKHMTKLEWFLNEL